MSNFSTGDYVGIAIHKVDRTNLDPKLLPTIILEKKDKFKVACEYGIIDQWWSLDSMMLLSTVPEGLVNLDTSNLPNISFIAASKLYVRCIINGSVCSCKGGSKTKQCPCKKKNISCSTKCHKTRGACFNLQ